MAKPPMRAMSRAYGHQTQDVPQDASFDRAIMLRAWKFAAHYKKRLFLNFLVIIAAALVGTLPPLVFKQLIDHAIPERDFGMVNLLFAATIGLAFLNTALGVTSRWFSASIGEGLIFDLRVKLYEHVQRMPMAFFTRTQTGSLLSRFNHDVVGAQATVTTSATVTSDIVTLTVTLCAMIVLSWQVTFLALTIVPIFILLDRKIGNRISELSRTRMDANADMTTTVQERFNVSGALLVKLFGRTNDEINTYGAKADLVRSVGVRMTTFMRAYYGVFSLIGALGVAIVYWLGARSVINGGLTIGTLTALGAYVTRLYDPITSIAGARVDLLSALISFERCFEVLDTPIAIKDKPDAKKLTSPKGKVEFESVWFRYPSTASVTIPSLETVTTENSTLPSEWILKNVSFTAEPGETIALVGPSGAGKTTLSSLVPRLVDVDEGSVRIDDNDVRDLTLESLQHAIGTVSQDTHLFHDSIAANLRYAKPDATDDELVEVCKSARIHHVIAALPDGYATVVGERGYRLSGGEKQRVAIARVLLKQPAVVILDEATAHLDSETELLVQQALSEALSGRTAIVIAHRLSTIRSADKIIVLDQGEIIESGTHVDLITRGGLYADLHDAQNME